MAFGQRLQLGIYEEIGGALIADFSHNGENITPSTGEHGFESLTFDVPLTLSESFRYYDTLANKWAVLSNGASVVWEGFVERPAVTATGISITAMGTWRELSRDKYTALWSDTSTKKWDLLLESAAGNQKQASFKADTNNRLYMAPNKSAAFLTGNFCGFFYRTPDSSNRQIIGVQFDYEITASTSWDISVQRRNNDGSFLSTVATITATGSQLNGSVFLVLTACDALSLHMAANANVTHTGETGSSYTIITNLRTVTITDSRVNTNTSTTISAGSNVVTPLGMANIYVGQRLFIDTAAAPSESVIVTAITSTTFTATFVNAYSGTTTIKAHVVYPDEIIEDIISDVSAIDGTHLSSSTALVQSPNIDLLDEAYEDENPIKICSKLARLGDNSGNVWESGVLNDQTLYFRPRASAGRHWYVDPVSLSVSQDIGALSNSVYAKYKDANGRTLRTAATEDTASQSAYGATIKSFVRANTTSEASAELIQATALADRATPAPEVGLIVDRLFDSAGAQYPLYEARNGDMVTMRSLSPVLSTDIDRIRTFRLSGHSYNANEDDLLLMPERPVPELARLVARNAEGITQQ